jgi:hypothetical protein
MSKAEKEALWAQDRALQQLEQNPAAASLLSAAAAAAAAAAAGSGPSLSAFDHSSLQAHPAAAAAAASSLYGQLLANPQLAVALAAQGNTAAAAAAAAAGLLQSNHAAALAGGGSGPWNAMGAGALGAAGLGPSNAALAAAAAAAAASGRMGGYYGQMAGLGGGDHMQGANLQQYLAAGGLSNQVLQQVSTVDSLQNSYIQPCRVVCACTFLDVYKLRSWLHVCLCMCVPQQPGLSEQAAKPALRTNHLLRQQHLNFDPVCTHLLCAPAGSVAAAAGQQLLRPPRHPPGASHPGCPQCPGPLPPADTPDKRLGPTCPRPPPQRFRLWPEHAGFRAQHAGLVATTGPSGVALNTFCWCGRGGVAAGYHGQYAPQQPRAKHGPLQQQRGGLWGRWGSADQCTP